MTYQKPAIVQVDSALLVIQGLMKGSGQPDSNHQPSTNAYESDE